MRRGLFSLLLALAFVPAELSGQVRSNFASSITSESMASVWVARQYGLFQKIWP